MSIRLRWADSIVIQVDGIDTPLPAFAANAVKLDDPSNPTILVASERRGLDWRCLESVCPALTQLIQRKAPGDVHPDPTHRPADANTS